MADETTDGPAGTGPRDEDPGPSEVLGNLPSRRPARRSARRPAAAPSASVSAPAAAARAPVEVAMEPTPETTAAPEIAPVPERATTHVPGLDLALSATVTAIEVAGELAHIGFTFTRQVVRATVGRLPRP